MGFKISSRLAIWTPALIWGYAGDWGGELTRGRRGHRGLLCPPCLELSSPLQSQRSPKAQGWPCCRLAPLGKLQLLSGAHDK